MKVVARLACSLGSGGNLRSKACQGFFAPEILGTEAKFFFCNCSCTMPIFFAYFQNRPVWLYF